MKKLLILTTLFVCSTLSFVSAKDYRVERFHSWNQPLVPAMSDIDTMRNYRNDLDAYVNKIDALIKELISKKKQAISKYNSDAIEYNSDTFFNKDGNKVPLYKKSPSQQHIIILSNED